MVAITAAAAPASPDVGRPPHSSPHLDAELRTARAQLADWVTCPSAKTPQGKAEIAKFSEKVESVKMQIKQSDGTSATAPTARPDESSDASRTRIASGDGLRQAPRPGALVDIYA